MSGKYGLIGKKLSHSYSPQIHALLGDYEYELFELEESDVAPFLEKRAFSAINVTIPYKKTVMPFLDKIDDSAEKIGSVNTVVKQPDGTLTGYNTDYFGFTYMLKKGGMDVRGRKCLVLGDGGASLTVQAVLRDLGAGEIVVASLFTQTNYENLYLHYDSEIIINATPVGMYPKNLESLVDVNDFPRLVGAADVIYNPQSTKLILDAQKKGVANISGLYMLCAQAKAAAELFFNREYPDEIIEKILRKLSFELTNIILVGMPGCGKTTVGGLLAKRYGRRLVDTDELIEKKAGVSIPEIFTEKGEKEFRRLEAEVVAEVGKEKGLVIATGGGVIVTPENHDALRQNGTVIFINRDTSHLDKSGRPLSQTNDLNEMLKKRLPLYRSICHKEVDGNDSPERVVEKIEELFI